MQGLSTCEMWLVYCCIVLGSDLLSLDGRVFRLVSGWSGLLVGFVRTVNGDLDSDLTILDLLSVHLQDGLLLLLLICKSDKAEATSLAGLVTSLELLDHEAWDWAKGDLGRDRLVGSK